MRQFDQKAATAIAELASMATTGNGELPGGRARWLATFAAAGERSQRARRAAWGAGVLVAAAALLALYRWPHAAKALTFEVRGAAEANGYVQAPLGSAAQLAFSDGSEIELAPATRVRISHLTPFGSELSLDSGSVRAHIIPRQGNAWSVHAGPFAVDVVGTTFRTQWDHTTGRLEVAVDEGKVSVRGPLREPSAVSAGQHLEADLTSREESISTISPTSLAPPRSSEMPAAAPIDASVPREEGRVTKKPTEPSWRGLLADGHFDQVLAAAKARGLDKSIDSSGLDDLEALADAARYRGQTALASRALAAQRSRFAGSEAASKAAYLLGRMAQDAGNALAAIAWFETYLTESKGGPLSVEALGRQMQATVAASGVVSARPLAQRYLAQFRSGPHAAEARRILGEP